MARTLNKKKLIVYAVIVIILVVALAFFLFDHYNGSKLTGSNNRPSPDATVSDPQLNPIDNDFNQIKNLDNLSDDQFNALG